MTGWTGFGPWCAASSTTTASPTSKWTATERWSPTTTAPRCRALEPRRPAAGDLGGRLGLPGSGPRAAVTATRCGAHRCTAPARSITSGVLPARLLFAHPGYLRAARGIVLPGRHQLFLHGCDVSRGGDGAFTVNADWTQAPSGAGYALADRRVIAHAAPDLYERIGPRPCSPWAQALRLALLDAAPEAAG